MTDDGWLFRRSSATTAHDVRRRRVGWGVSRVNQRRLVSALPIMGWKPMQRLGGLVDSASSAVEVERFREVGLSPSAHLGMKADLCLPIG
jgi:hypothetical protein